MLQILEVSSDAPGLSGLSDGGLTVESSGGNVPPAAKLAAYKANPQAVDAAVMGLVPVYATVWDAKLKGKPVYWPDEFAMWSELKSVLASEGGGASPLYQAAQWRILQTAKILPPTPESKAAVEKWMEENYKDKPGAWSVDSWADAQKKWRAKEPLAFCGELPWLCDEAEKAWAVGLKWANVAVPYAGLALGVYIGLRIFLPRRA